MIVLPAGILGGLTGGLLLLHTTEALFSNLVPFLILLATGLLAIQTPLRNWLARRQEKGAAQILPGKAWGTSCPFSWPLSTAGILALP